MTQHAKEPAQGRDLNPSWFLRLFDKCTGILVELFDPRLLTVFVGMLVAYTVYFTHRKLPEGWRWWQFDALGMVLVGLVALVARAPDFLRRFGWHRGMATLWFALHTGMFLSGFFSKDWLPDAVSLLVAYPFLFAVLCARDDTDTFHAVARGAVWAVLPFILLSYLTRTVIIGYPGFSGIFYNANGLAMCATILSVCALLLAYVAWQGKRKIRMVLYGAICCIGLVTVALTISRTAWLTCVAVMGVLVACLSLRHPRYTKRRLIRLGCLVLVAGAALTYVTITKARQTIEEDKLSSFYYNETVRKAHLDLPYAPEVDPSLTMDAFSSERLPIWRAALGSLTWNGHPKGYISEWMEDFGTLHPRNAHNSYIQVAYNHGWPTGVLFLAYVLFSAYRAWLYFWRQRHTRVMAVAPLLVTTLFMVTSLFESVYTPFSAVGCLYLLVQGVLWRKDLIAPEAVEEAGA